MTVICPYCRKDANLVDGSVIYPHRADLHAKPFWHCHPCGAWVGCHPGTQTALGRLANAELRAAKQRAHAAFDPLWMKKWKKDGGPKGRARGKGYAWLTLQLGIKPGDCHIGEFDVGLCNRVVEICQSLKRRPSA